MQVCTNEFLGDGAPDGLEVGVLEGITEGLTVGLGVAAFSSAVGFTQAYGPTQIKPFAKPHVDAQQSPLS